MPLHPDIAPGLGTTGDLNCDECGSSDSVIYGLRAI